MAALIPAAAAMCAPGCAGVAGAALGVTAAPAALAASAAGVVGLGVYRYMNGQPVLTGGSPDKNSEDITNSKDNESESNSKESGSKDSTKLKDSDSSDSLNALSEGLASALSNFSGVQLSDLSSSGTSSLLALGGYFGSGSATEEEDPKLNLEEKESFQDAIEESGNETDSTKEGSNDIDSTKDADSEVPEKTVKESSTEIFF